MASPTTIVPIRIPHSLAARVKATAAGTGRTTSGYIKDILIAALGDERRRA
jgi:predicted DNA-binding protein